MEIRVRSIAKTLSWRVVASGANAVIIFAIIGNASLAVGIGAIDLVAKSIFYYGHERMWNKIKWGRNIIDSKKITS